MNEDKSEKFDELLKQARRNQKQREGRYTIYDGDVKP